MQMVTTAWVLTELADAMAGIPERDLFPRFLNDLRLRPHALILPATQVLFDGGVTLYSQRPDKKWSLTDCI